MRAFIVLAGLAIATGGCDLTGDLVYGGTGGASPAVGGSTPQGGGGAGAQGGGGGEGGGAGGAMSAGWTLQLGSAAQSERVGGFAIDGDTLILAGGYSGMVDIGGVPLSGTDETDIFITPVNATSGSPIPPPYTLAGTGVSSVGDVAIMESGAIAVGGIFEQDITLITTNLTNTTGADASFVAVFTANLVNAAWALPLDRFSNPGYVRLSHLATEGSQVFAAGSGLSTLRVGGEILSAGNAACDDYTFVASLDVTQEMVDWAIIYGTTSDNLHPVSMDTNPTHLYVAGDLLGMLDEFNCDSHAGTAMDAAFVGNEAQSGTGADVHLYVIDHIAPSGEDYVFGSPQNDHVSGVAADATGVWVTGSMGAPGTCGNLHDIEQPGAFICRFNNSGAPTASRAFGGSLAPHTIAIDGNTLYIAGDDPELIDLGDGAPRSGAYIARFNITDTSIAHEETRRMNGTATFTNLVPTTNALFVAGNLAADIELGETLLLSTGGTDVFVASLPR